MGTKRQLSPKIGEIISDCQPGPLLDAFAGMCSVGSEVSPSRQIWANDLQSFSNTVAAALFRSADWPLAREMARNVLLEPFQANFRALAGRHGASLQAESQAVAACDSRTLRFLFDEAIERTAFAQGACAGIYDLFTERFGGLYFGIAQAMEIDSLRAAADHALKNVEINEDEHRWLLVAMGVAMNRCTTSTGHFAQPLAPKVVNSSRIAKQRKRSILNDALDALAVLKPVGNKRWRAKNMVFSSEACDLLFSLQEHKLKPAVIYADPPYTADQYSRYYHVYDTLIRYDYPDCKGRGRYREDRAVSNFCLPRQVRGALERLITNSHALGADMVLSYPENGLLPDSRNELTSLFLTHYGKEPTVARVSHSHSTMGGSKGPASADVVEHIYRVAA